MSTWKALFARDSWLWTAMFYLGLVATGLSVVSDPATYGIPSAWMPYVRLVALIAAIVGGKMGLSFLPAKRDLIPLLLISTIALSGCAGTLRDRVRTSAVAGGELVLTLDQEEYALYAAGAYGADPVAAKAKHLEIGDKVDVAILAVRSYERAARAWPETAPTMPQSVAEAQAAALKALTAIERIVDGIPHNEGILRALASVRAKVGG